MAKLIMVLWLYCVSFQLNAMSEASANWLFEKQKQCDIKIDSLKKIYRTMLMICPKAIIMKLSFLICFQSHISM